MAAASTTAMNTNKSENNAEEDSDEVIYDLTTDFRAASRALGEIQNVRKKEKRFLKLGINLKDLGIIIQKLTKLIKVKLIKSN